MDPLFVRRAMRAAAVALALSAGASGCAVSAPTPQGGSDASTTPDARADSASDARFDAPPAHTDVLETDAGSAASDDAAHRADSSAPTDAAVRPRDGGHTVDGCAPSGAEASNAACSDGVDNDCDGYVDCMDFDCSRSTSVTICGGGGDGGAPRDGGRPHDAGSCVSHPERTNAACSNGVDDDCDGYVDCMDFDCSRNAAVTVCM